MLLKWLFNALLFLWIYHAILRPLFIGYFYGNTRKNQSPKANPRHQNQGSNVNWHKAAPQKKDDDEEYADYEEIK